MPSVFAAAQQGLQAEKMEEKSAIRSRYHRRNVLANFCQSALHTVDQCCTVHSVDQAVCRRSALHAIDRHVGRRVRRTLRDDAPALSDAHLAALAREQGPRAVARSTYRSVRASDSPIALFSLRLDGEQTEGMIIATRVSTYATQPIGRRPIGRRCNCYHLVTAVECSRSTSPSHARSRLRSTWHRAGRA